MNAAGEWSRVSCGEFTIPVPVKCVRALGGALVYEGRDARIDVRVEQDGDIVDPARISGLEAELRLPSGAAKVLMVGGRPAVRVEFERDDVYVLSYLLGGRPRVADADVQFPELRIVYAFSGHAAAAWRGEAKTRMEDEAASIAKALIAHPLTPDGHLAFGPVYVPREFDLIGDDGEQVALPPTERQWREVEVGGGAIYLIESPRGGANPESVEFRPVALDAVGADSAVGLVSAGIDDLSARGMCPRLLGSESRPCVFAQGTALVYSLEHAGRDGGMMHRRGYVWTDLLGYSWELVYSMRNSDQRDWKGVFGLMERGSPSGQVAKNV